MRRGEVRQVGRCHPDGYLTGFWIDGGDYPGTEYKRGRNGTQKFHAACGWPLVQLVLMARTGRALKPPS